jgi:hypothetical protein
MIQELLDICTQYHVYVQILNGKVLVACGHIIGLGATIPEAIENWCQEVEKRGLV